MSAEWIFNRGDTIAVPYLIIEGFDEIGAVSAVIKFAINPDQPIVPPDWPFTDAMAFAPIAEATGWYVGLSAEQSAMLEPDLYATQVRMQMVDGTVKHGDPLLIRINEPVTEDI
ncbi:hypothetical protein [Sphingobium sp. WCS2017Hpa-17]|uniref:hypothetical protein n=1 Tax=Sphingobium sp. WCS2017Hpa-17 TaxID=3073638 RepID=UPI00288AB874|nr:hypothetical protein [Sphingobium sp. WCS2017Hpa-17]